MKHINLPLHISEKQKVKMSKSNLKILPNGLMICKVQFINPDNSTSFICDALIDTGAEISLICKTVFDKLSYNKENVFKRGASTLDGDEMVDAVNINIRLPHNNWASFQIGVYVKDFSKREEYNALIGMDILSNYQLVYNGLNKTAWLDEL